MRYKTRKGWFQLRRALGHLAPNISPDVRSFKVDGMNLKIADAASGSTIRPMSSRLLGFIKRSESQFPFSAFAGLNVARSASHRTKAQLLSGLRAESSIGFFELQLLDCQALRRQPINGTCTVFHDIKHCGAHNNE